MCKNGFFPPLVLAFVIVLGLSSAAGAEPFSYGGRLTEPSGKPLEGIVDLTLSFHTTSDPSTSSPIGAPITFAGVALASGVFQVDLDAKLTATQLRALFADPSLPVWVQVTVGSTDYPRQRFGVVPYALKVPIDNLTLGYDLQGRLQLNTADDGQAGYVLSTDGSGTLSWIDFSGLGGGGGAAVENQIVNGEATKAPAQDAVFDALTLRDTAIAGKEPALAAGTASQFYRGDKSWQTLDTTAVPENGSLYFTAARAKAAAVADSITDGVTDVAPSQNAVADALTTKEGSFAAGTSAQYFRGDKSWQTLDTATVPESGNLYFTAARAKSAAVADAINDGVADVAASQNAVYDALATRDSAIAGKENAFGAGTIAQYLRGDKSWQTLNTAGVPESGSLYFTNARAQGAAVADSITDAVTNVAPSQNAVFDALAAKEAAFAAGTTLQYLRGDKSWQSLDTTAVAEGTNLYYTDARAKAAAVADSTTDGVTDVAASQNAVFDGLALKQSLTQKNAANGYAGLDAGGKILPANLPYAGLAFKGTWDAGTNTPTLTSSACGTSGDYYITAAGGATNLDGITTWSLGDWAICGTGSVWTRVGNPSGSGITTINGLTGATVNLITDNINEGSTNLYFSNARAKSAAVSNTITDAVNDVAPSQNAVFDALALKEGSLTVGTSAQYYRGDKTWQTLNTQNVAEHASNLYFTNARAQSAAVADQIVDATTTVAPSQNAVFDALAGKEPAITAGTATQYLRGDKTWQTLSTTNVTEGTNQYFTTARAKSAAVSNTLTDGVTDIAPSQDVVFDALATRDTSISGKEPAITGGTTAQYWRGDKTWQTVVQDAVSDGVTTVAPSQNAVFDLLATKSSTAHSHSSLDASDGTPTQALVVDASGNVGIGSAAPQATFEIAKSTNGLGLTSFAKLTSTNNAAVGDGPSLDFNEQGNSGTSFMVGRIGTVVTNAATASMTGDMVFRTMNSTVDAEKMRITGAGNVGIGTTVPGKRLSVEDSSDVTNVGIVSRNAGTHNASIELLASTGRKWGLLSTGTSDGDGAHLFQIRDNNASADRLTIDGSGNFGIGTTVPSVRLHLFGGSALVDSDTSAGTLTLQTQTGTWAGNLMFNAPNAAAAQTTFGQIFVDPVVKTAAAETGSMRFRTKEGGAYQNSLTLLGGNVGVNSTTPGQKLTVDGTFGILETGASPTYHTIFQGGDQTADVTYTLPVNAGTNNYVLSTNGSGVLTWVAPTTTTPAFSSIASGTNTSAAMTVGSGASLAPIGTGTVTANQFVGSGSSSNAIDLATAEVAGTLPVARGGTNSGTALNNNRIMVSNGGGIVEAAALTNGQLLVGSTGAAPVAAALTGTANQITVTPGAGSITLSTPQSIHTGASPTFLGLTVSGLTDGVAHVTSGTITGGKVNLASSSDVTGTLAVGSGGTGATSLAGYGALVMNAGGTAATSVAPSTSGNVLTSNGTSWTSQPPNSSFSNLNVTGNIDSTTSNSWNFVTSTGYNTASGNFQTRGARGTQGSPSASQTDDSLGMFGAIGYGATGFASSAKARIAMNAAQNWTDSAQGTYMHFLTTQNGTTTPTTRMLIDNAGNVGIGTTSPQGKLHVVTTGQIQGLFDGSNNATALLNGTGLVLANTDQTANNRVGIIFSDATGGVGSGAAASIEAAITDHTNNYGTLGFITRGSGGFAERLTINETGNVGINTASPTATLQVEGGAFVRGGDGDANGDGSLVAMDLLTLINYLNAGAGGSLTPLQYSRLDINGDGRVDMLDSAMITDVINATKTVSQAQTAGKAIANSSWGVDGSGRFGIGTLSPTAKLHVGGTAGVDGIKFPDGTLQTTAATSSTTRIVKTANTARSNTVTLADDPDLTFSLAANEGVMFEFTLFINVATNAPDWQFALQGPASPTALQYVGMRTGCDGSGGPVDSTTSTVYGTALPNVDCSVAGTSVETIKGYVKNGSTAGNVRVQWAQRVSNAANTSMMAGSNVIIHRLP